MRGERLKGIQGWFEAENSGIWQSSEAGGGTQVSKVQLMGKLGTQMVRKKSPALSVGLFPPTATPLSIFSSSQSQSINPDVSHCFCTGYVIKIHWHFALMCSLAL